MKEIILSNSDKIGLVDDEDYERLNQYTWRLGRGNYIQRSIYNVELKKTKHISMHQDVMRQNYIDHKNHNKLDNRKENLRACTRQQNVFNSLKTTKRQTSSIYKGVSLHKIKWRVSIVFNNKHLSLGMYINEIDAAHAYDMKAIELFGEFACLNFPDFDYTNYEIKNTVHKTSKFKGVSFDKSVNKWLCMINKIKIGRYNKEEIAAEHYDYVSFLIFKNKDRLNFPLKDYNNFQPIKINKILKTII